MANDNFISYQHRFIVENKVTWLEATIACPIFTGLLTYYIEGDTNERGHLMEEALANPQRAIGIRGNCFLLSPAMRIRDELPFQSIC